MTSLSDAFDDYDYARALERTERLFWSFTDDYVELVKGRAYGAQGAAAAASARAALEVSLDTLLRLFAPVLPYVTEEVWSWWKEGSIHRSPWPESVPLRVLANGASQDVLDVAADVLSEVRRAKTEAKVSLRVEAETVHVRDTAERLALLELAAADVIDAGKIRDLQTTEADEFAVEVALVTD